MSYEDTRAIVGDRSTLPPPFRMERQTLPFIVPAGFERFYRARLRWVHGSRVKSEALFRAYCDWAQSEREGSMTRPMLRACMVGIGHRHLHSNGIVYCDVGFAVDVPQVPDNFRLLRGCERGAPIGADLVGRIDQALAELINLRATVARLHGYRAPEGQS